MLANGVNKLLILPNGVSVRMVGSAIICNTRIRDIAILSGVRVSDDHDVSRESSSRVNEWLIHHMDEAPFQKLCYDSFITAKDINNYLIENGNESASAIDSYHRMTPLHMLSMNPKNAPADAIASLLNANIETSVYLDATNRTPLDFANAYNVDGLVAMISVLCLRKNSTMPGSVQAKNENE
jgi:ankyrin repeat protein